MKVISIQNPVTFQKCKDITSQSVMAGAMEIQEMYLRRQFESANIDSTAAAVIEVATKLGHTHLAIELMTELNGKEATNESA